MRKIIRLLLVVLTAVMLIVCLEGLSDYVVAVKTQKNVTAEKQNEKDALQNAVADVSYEEAEQYERDAEKLREGNERLEKENGELKTQISDARAEYEKLKEENEFYTEICDELLKGKNKIEGYLADGD